MAPAVARRVGSEERVVQFVCVGQVGDLGPGEMKAVRAGRHFVGIANVEGGWYAFDDTCTHEEASLTEGELYDFIVECPLHGATFDIRTGSVESFPATIPLPTYDIRIVDGEIHVATEPRERL